jgi:hypothetical protein
MSTKPQNKSKAPPPSTQPVGKAKVGKAVARKKKGRPVAAEPPDESRIEQVAAALTPADQDLFRRLILELAENLGSTEAAHLWLVTRDPEFGVTPLTAISQGKANLVLAVLESRWGPGPVYG